MGDLAASRAVAVIIGAAFVWIGVGFGGYALMLALSDRYGVVASAAITGAVLVLLPALVLAFSLLVRPKTLPAVVEPEPEVAVLSLLAAIARKRPLLAVLGAGVFGAADVLWTKRR